MMRINAHSIRKVIKSTGFVHWVQTFRMTSTVCRLLPCAIIDLSTSSDQGPAKIPRPTILLSPLKPFVPQPSFAPPISDLKSSAVPDRIDLPPYGLIPHLIVIIKFHISPCPVSNLHVYRHCCSRSSSHAHTSCASSTKARCIRKRHGIGNASADERRCTRGAPTPSL